MKTRKVPVNIFAADDVKQYVADGTLAQSQRKTKAKHVDHSLDDNDTQPQHNETHTGRRTNMDQDQEPD